jgi:DNA-binding transcriptional MocR family regulator
MSKFEYLKLADTVAAEIASGALKSGDRLPPQRSFAYERGIAVSTASRVYTELLRRGLVVGEAPSFQDRRAAAARPRPNRAARASIWNSIIRCCRRNRP